MKPGTFGLVLSACLAAACQAKAADFERVEIRVVGTAGDAHKSVAPDGTIAGGHLTGTRGGPPIIRRDSGRIDAADLAALATLIDTLPTTPSPQSCGESRREVAVTRAGQRVVHEACGDTPFADPAAAAIFALIRTQKVGGW